MGGFGNPPGARPAVVTQVREGFTGADLDLLIELAYETLKRRDMHRKAGRGLTPLPGDEDRLRRMLRDYRFARGMADYELSERTT